VSRLVSWELVGACPGDRAGERARLQGLERVLGQWLTREEFGFHARALHSADDALDERIDVDKLRARAGEFPLVWVNVSFAEGALDEADLMRLQDEGQLTRLL
jgi:hypothetical protein